MIGAQSHHISDRPIIHTTTKAASMNESAPNPSSFSPTPAGALGRGLIALCRPGFEKELAAELDAYTNACGLSGFARAVPGSGVVVHESPISESFDDWAEHSEWRRFIFARQVSVWFAHVSDLPENDRATPLALAARSAGQRFSKVWLEHTDTDAARPLSGFCRRFQAPLEKVLHINGVLRPGRKQPHQLHVLFTGTGEAWLSASRPGTAAPWPMGIARLRMPREAGSRSTLKLAEAIQGLLSEEERERLFRGGMRAVDLGAAPGGWSWQLAWRGLRVTAVDNGRMADSVLATDMVEHVRADGFNWRPRGTVDWVVCDMVEQPARIAALMGEWIGARRARHAIFNLKLPMKKRLAAIQECRTLIHTRLSGVGAYDLRIKHLYHDREEVTAYLTLRG